MDIRILARIFFPLLCVLFFGIESLDGARAGGRISGRSSRGRGTGGSRSSGVRYSSSSYVRSPSRVGSTYVSYVPSVRYTRAYSSARIGAGYWYYYSLYFSYARSPAYLRRQRHYDDNVGVCVNYEDNGNDTVLGIFTCPLLDEEPDDYTFCCGDQYAEYCCEKTEDGHALLIVGAVFAVIIGIVVILAVIRHFKLRGAMKGRVVAQPVAATVVTQQQLQVPNNNAQGNMRQRPKLNKQQQPSPQRDVNQPRGPGYVVAETPPPPYPPTTEPVRPPPYHTSQNSRLPPYPINSTGGSMRMPEPSQPTTGNLAIPVAPSNIYAPQPTGGAVNDFTYSAYPAEPPPSYSSTS